MASDTVMVTTVTFEGTYIDADRIIPGVWREVDCRTVEMTPTEAEAHHARVRQSNADAIKVLEAK